MVEQNIPPDLRRVSRRQVLKLGVAGATMAALVSCGPGRSGLAVTETAPAATATPMLILDGEQSLANIRRLFSFPVFVPTAVPAGLNPDVLVTDDGRPAGPLVTINYWMADSRLALQVLNGPAGCCLDADPRRRRNAVKLPTNITGYFLPIEPVYGGPILWWQQEGAYIALSGPQLTRDELVRISASTSSTADLL